MMEGNCLILIPVLINKGAQQQFEFIEVHPYDTPLQMAYKFCQLNKIDSSLIQLLSGSIALYIRIVMQQEINPSIRIQLSTYFCKFISEIKIIYDSRVMVIDKCIKISLTSDIPGDMINNKNQSQIEQKQKLQLKDQILSKYEHKNINASLDFSFEQNDPNNISTEKGFNRQDDDTPYFYNLNSNQTKNSIKNLSKESIAPNKKLNHWIKQNSLQQITQLSSYNLQNEKIIKRLSRSPSINDRQLQPQNYLDQLHRKYSLNNSSSLKKTIAKGSRTHPKLSNEQKEVSTSQFNAVDESHSENEELNQSSSTVVNLRVSEPKKPKNIEKSFQCSRSKRAESFREIIPKTHQIATPIRSINTTPRKPQIYSQYLRQQQLQNPIEINKYVPNYQKLEGLLKKQSVLQLKTEQKIQLVFAHLDKDKNGYIDKNTLQKVKLGAIMRKYIDPVLFEISTLTHRIDRMKFVNLVSKRLNALTSDEKRQFLYTSIQK